MLGLFFGLIASSDNLDSRLCVCGEVKVCDWRKKMSDHVTISRCIQTFD